MSGNVYSYEIQSGDREHNWYIMIRARGESGHSPQEFARATLAEYLESHPENKFICQPWRIRVWNGHPARFDPVATVTIGLPQYADARDADVWRVLAELRAVELTYPVYTDGASGWRCRACLGDIPEDRRRAHRCHATGDETSLPDRTLTRHAD